MAFAEYDVIIHRDALSVYNFLLDPGHLPLWREGVRSVELLSGGAGAKGAVYRQTIAGPGGRPVAADFEIIEARTGAEIQYQVLVGPARPHGGYYLSTEGPSTRVRFALNYAPKGFMVRMTNPFRRRMKAEVGQLERLKSLLEDMPAAE